MGLTKPSGCQRYLRVGLCLLLAGGFRATSTPAHAQAAPLEAGPQAAVIQQALAEARTGREEPLRLVVDQWKHRALPLLAGARFDPDVKVRRAVIDAIREAPAVPFLLPMLRDEDRRVVRAAASEILWYFRPAGPLRRLNLREAAPYFTDAIRNDPELVRNEPELLILLAQMRNDVTARRLLTELLREHRRGAWPAAAHDAEGRQMFIVSLLARCEAGRTPASEAVAFFRANPVARHLSLHHVRLLKNETLLRYSLSLLRDTTMPYGPSNSEPCVGTVRISSEAWETFSLATGLDIEATGGEGAPEYSPKDVARLYQFFGLRPE